MHIHVPAGSPWWVCATADTALALHVGGGITGLVSGFAAAIAPKGGRSHRIAGRIFVASMLVVAGIGTITAPILPRRLNIAAGVSTAYFVLSAWTTVRRRTGGPGPTDAATMSVGILGVAICAWLIWIGSQSANAEVDGQDYHPLIVFAALVTMGVCLDGRMLIRGGLSGSHRVARHLWRMCLALFVASASFFLGQPQLFPTWLLQSNVLFVPALAPLALLVVWMARIRFGSRWPGRMIAP